MTEGATPHEEMLKVLMTDEERLRDSFDHDVGQELEVADASEALLAVVLTSVGPKTGTVLVDRAGVPASGDVATLILMALTYIGVRALRVMRAARSTLASGYEAESRVHDRILIELLEHRAALLADSTGKVAKDWLEGKRGRGISRRIADMSPAEMYANLCLDAHGDPRPLARLVGGDGKSLMLGPKRTVATKASLLMHAGFARDQAMAIATFASLELGELEPLDVAIRAGWDRLLGVEEIGTSVGAARAAAHRRAP